MIRSASCSGSTTRRSIVPTYPPARTDGRSARIAPPTTTRCDLRDDDAGLREVDELAHEIGRTERAFGTAHRASTPSLKRDDSVDVRDTGRSDQVFHADGSNLAGFGDHGPRSGSTESIPGPAIRSSAASDGSLATRSRVRPTGIAFRSPSANIRHRFGGHLRAARMRDPSAVARPCTTVRQPSAGEGVRDRRRGRRASRQGPAPDRARWFRPVIWRRLNETAQGECARGRQHPGVRGVQLEQWSVAPRRSTAPARQPAAAQRQRPRHEGRAQARRHASPLGAGGGRRPADPQGRAAGGRRRPTRPAASVATPSSSSRSTMPSTASTTSSRALPTCRPSSPTRRSSASSDRTTRPSRRSRSRSATRPACSSAARPTPTRR